MDSAAEAKERRIAAGRSGERASKSGGRLVGQRSAAATGGNIRRRARAAVALWRWERGRCL